MPLNIPFKSATYHKHGGLVVDFGVIDHTNTATYARSEKWVHALRNVPFQDQGVPDDWYKSGGWCFISNIFFQRTTNFRMKVSRATLSRSWLKMGSMLPRSLRQSRI